MASIHFCTVLLIWLGVLFTLLVLGTDLFADLVPSTCGLNGSPKIIFLYIYLYLFVLYYGVHIFT